MSSHSRSEIYHHWITKQYSDREIHTNRCCTRQYLTEQLYHDLVSDKVSSTSHSLMLLHECCFHFGSIYIARVGQRLATALTQAGHRCATALRVHSMVVCTQCHQTAAKHCQFGLCGKCCLPRCADEVHNARHSVRGVQGKQRRRKWGEFWSLSMSLAKRWLDCHICKKSSLFLSLDFKETRRLFLEELKCRVQAEDDEPMRDTHPVISSVCPPSELENIVAYLKKEFTKSQARAAVNSDLTDPDCFDDWSDTESAQFPQGRSELTFEPVGIDISYQRPTKMRARYDDDLRPRLDPMAEIASQSVSSTQDKYKLPPHSPKDRAATTGGQPCSHYRRDWPPISHQSSTTAPPRLVTGPAELRYDFAKNILEDWFSDRLDLCKILDEPLAKEYKWSPSSKDEYNPDLHSAGKWFWCGLKRNKWIPLPPDETDCERRILRDVPLDTFIHASNMYIVHRALIGGLEPGPSAGKGGLKGVFAYRPVGNSIALSSAGYAVYSDLASNGLYFSPRFELAVNTQAAAMQGVKMSAGNAQYALPLGYFYIRFVDPLHQWQRRDERQDRCLDTSRRLAPWV